MRMYVCNNFTLTGMSNNAHALESITVYVCFILVIRLSPSQAYIMVCSIKVDVGRISGRLALEASFSPCSLLGGYYSLV